MTLTQLELHSGNVAAAAAHAEAAAAEARSIDDMLRLPGALMLRGVCLSALEDPRAAHGCFLEAIDLVLRTGDAQPLSWAMLGCAWLHHENDRTLAARLLGASSSMIEKIGVGGRWSDVGMAEQFRGLAADRLREVLGIEAFERLTAEGAALSLEQAVALARLPPTPL